MDFPTSGLLYQYSSDFDYVTKIQTPILDTQYSHKSSMHEIVKLFNIFVTCPPEGGTI